MTDICSLLLCNKRDEILIDSFLRQYRKVMGPNHIIILGADKDNPPTNNHGLHTLYVKWDDKAGKRISEAMFDCCLITKTQGCIKIDVDCYVRDMDWVDMRYDYIGHSIKGYPDKPMGLSYFINKLALGTSVSIPCARFQGKAEAQIVYKNLGSIPKEKIMIYSAEEVPRKVSNYSWNKDSSLIHVGEFKYVNDISEEIFDREKSLQAFKDLEARYDNSI